MIQSEHRSRLRFFNSREGKIAYVDEGKGPVILLIHGVPTSSWLYRNIIPGLTESGKRVIAIDMLGYGYSDKPEGYEIYNAANYGRRLLELMDHLRIEKWTQAVHDGGGLWTWEMLKQNEKCMTRLIAFNTIFYQEGFHPPLKFERGFIAHQYAKLYKIKFGQSLVINGTFKNGMKEGNRLSKEALNGYKLPLRGNGDQAMYYFFTQTCFEVPDYRELHKSLNIPLTVIWGKHDEILVWKDIEEEVRKNFSIGESDIHILDAKHFIQEEEPERIVEIISGL